MDSSVTFSKNFYSMPAHLGGGGQCASLSQQLFTTILLLVCPNLASTGQTHADSSELIPQLLDCLIELGDLVREINHALGGNGHQADKAAELIQQLVNDRR